MVTDGDLNNCAAKWRFPLNRLSDSLRGLLRQGGKVGTSEAGTACLILDGHPLTDCLGRGAYAAVFAVDAGKGGKQALKLFDVDFSTDEPGVQSLIREAAAGMTCRSEYVARYERLMFYRLQGEDASSVAASYLLRELVDGQTPTHRHFDQMDPRPVFHCMARGLADIHDMGLVHRDIKPENAIVTGTTAKWLDLGQARIFGRQTAEGRTRPATARPSRVPPTVPPEALRGDRLEYGAWERPGDVFSLGATFCRLATGLWPCEPGDHRVVSPEAQKRLSDPEQVGEDIGKLVLDMLRASRPDRPPAGQVVRRLAQT